MDLALLFAAVGGVLIAVGAWLWPRRPGAARSEASSGGQAAVASESATVTQTIIGEEHIHLAPEDPLQAVPWWNQPGGPEIEVRPGREQVAENVQITLLGHLSVKGDIKPKYRWLGADIEMDPATPMPENRAGQYQMKGVKLTPSGDSDEVSLEVTFIWTDGGEHGCRWRWPIEKHSKGHWVLQSHLGTGLRDPERW